MHDFYVERVAVVQLPRDERLCDGSVGVEGKPLENRLEHLECVWK